MSSDISNSPDVRTPVLSNTICWIFAIFSIVLPPLIRIPFFAALPIPTITAVGVANPIAQGHEITKIAIDLRTISLDETSNIKTPIMNERRAIPITSGTKTALTLSPIFCISGLSFWASFTNWIIWDNTVLLPVLVTFILMLPSDIMVPPITSSPSTLLTPIVSPLIIDSSIKQSPLITIPSVGIISPWLIISKSFTLTSAKGIFLILVFSIFLAIPSWNCDKSEIDVVVFLTENCSKRFPSKTSVIIVAAVSKNKKS